MSSPAPAVDAAPYADLDPLTVLSALDAAGLPADGRLLQLNSYENRVWQASLEDGRVVVAKFYRPGRWSDAQILEEHRFCAELAAADLPVVPPLCLVPPSGPQAARPPVQWIRRPLADAMPDPRSDGPTDEDEAPTANEPVDGATLVAFRSAGGATYRLAVSDRRVGRAPELEQPEVLARLGRLMGRLHAVARRGHFVHRRRLDVATYGQAARQRLVDGGFVRPQTEGAWLRTCDAALAAVDAAFQRHGPLQALRLHGDCHPGNVLWRDEGAHAGPNFVDFDDCCSGPAVQDLWMLLPGERDAVAAAQHHLLDGYRDFMDFDDRELLLIEPLRTLRMIHHSAWIAERLGDPAFPVAFPWFASPAYWQQQTTELQEQLDRMQEA